MTSTTAGGDLLREDDMRLRSRFLLVALTWAALLSTTATLVFPLLDGGILDSNPLTWVFGTAWLFFMLVLLIEMSGWWSYFVIGLLFMALVLTPVFLSVGVTFGYGQFGMAATEATVIEAHSRPGHPASVLFEFEDGSRERGYSTKTTSDRYENYLVPAVGSSVHVLRDPAGLLPPRSAAADEATDEGKVAGIAAMIPAAVTLVLLILATVSALTRRESLLTRSAKENAARRLADDEADEPRSPRRRSPRRRHHPRCKRAEGPPLVQRHSVRVSSGTSSASTPVRGGVGRRCAPRPRSLVVRHRRETPMTSTVRRGAADPRVTADWVDATIRRVGLERDPPG